MNFGQLITEKFISKYWGAQHIGKPSVKTIGGLEPSCLLEFTPVCMHRPTARQISMGPLHGKHHSHPQYSINYRGTIQIREHRKRMALSVKAENGKSDTDSSVVQKDGWMQR